MTSVFGAGALAATIFFIVLGLFQLSCIVILLKSSSAILLTVGVLGNLVSIIIYFVSTSGVTIFGVIPQPLIPFAIIIKALEALFVLSSLYVMKLKGT
jgi:hypothetical protein